MLAEWGRGWYTAKQDDPLGVEDSGNDSEAIWKYPVGDLAVGSLRWQGVFGHCMVGGEAKGFGSF